MPGAVVASMATIPVLSWACVATATTVLPLWIGVGAEIGAWVPVAGEAGPKIGGLAANVGARPGTRPGTAPVAAPVAPVNDSPSPLALCVFMPVSCSGSEDDESLRFVQFVFDQI